MSSIDEDAYRLGINLKVWKEFRMRNWKEERGKQYRELPLDREMPLDRELHPERLVQGEFESIVDPIDDKEAKIRHLQAVRDRWFGYYKKYKGDRNRIIDQYNKIATMKQR